MPLSSIPRIRSQRPVRMKPARRGTFATVVLCLLLSVYIGFIAYSLLTQDTAIERQTAAAVTLETSTDTQIADNRDLTAAKP
ncbi:MAG: hypothetical protein ABJG15_17755 [Hyphomonadaceae bacterium]